ncbi:MAG: excinuclease ABC subunit A [Rhodobacteraceae bacterium]|jgi:hypothetical protein|uniref:Excinuclease ABC subunit A n=1 Tax=Salipiger profundus TaxID=1229727 RepID=A0A1U7D9R7_9RHOB|nr:MULTISPECIES: hypothetical protein [Salipiger]APX24805.1 hypothetical protein Ga0080559_TMP4009 [Salipiger profundus]MAB07723.1 excinuclease ABC subunit A [Paracoccaceae bacterium]GFZ97935.1 hypothetical protein GCM10011326_06640 [Salipiger profundus]SFC98701.1 hypothetical protein SAMN05444415_106188 [Salipiger profundus]
MFRKIALVALSATALSMPLTATASPKGCPPGLADKGCVPPGQAKKMPQRKQYEQTKERREETHRYRFSEGDRYDGMREVIENPERYGLTRTGTYYRDDNVVYRVDPDTRRVLDVIGALSALSQ